MMPRAPAVDSPWSQVVRLVVCLVVCLLGVAVFAPRAAAADPDRTRSPYFVVDGAATGVEAMPLASTHAEISISGVIADVVVTQVYRNEGRTPISARYVFPASTRAAVYGLRMKIGDRVIVARIKERAAARAEYEDARRAGKTASLLEQDRPNVFTMSVANILPQDRIEVELRYTELLVPTDGTYELVYPTVVGPRYGGELGGGYTPAGTPPAAAFDLRVQLAAGMPIQAIESPSHTLQTRLAANQAHATIDLDDPTGGDRDFILRYRLGGADLASGLLLFRGATENFFLMMVQPPRRPALELIPAREYVFIVDVSGSMHGFPLDVAKKLMADLLVRLRPSDTFNVLLFAGGSELWSATSRAATPANVADAAAFVTRQTGGGGTELLPALERALALPRAAAVSRSFVVVSDGYIGEEAAMFQHIRDHLGEANVFAFGIGSSVNRHLIEGIARAGQGEAFIVESEQAAAAVATRLRTYLEAPVLTGVQLAFRGFDAYDVEPRVLPDVFAERPVIVFGKWRGAPSGTLTVTGVSGRGRFVSTIDASTVTPDPAAAALSYLWARAKIARLSDGAGAERHRAEVLALGLAYNLLTRYTSFIAVQQVVRTAASPGGAREVEQPLPLPAGVSEHALGMEVGPEPALPVLLALVGLGLGLGAWRRRARRVAPRSAA